MLNIFRKKRLQNIRVDTSIVIHYIHQQELTEKNQAREAANFSSPRFTILRMYIEEGAETSVEINDTLMVYS